MPAIVKFTKVVQDAVRDFGNLFPCEPQRRHFAEYLTSPMIAQNKIVTDKGVPFGAAVSSELQWANCYC